MHKDTHSSKNILADKEIGMRQENIDLSNQLRKVSESESEILLPHERDETLRPTSPDNFSNKTSKEVIKQAYDDTKNGLKDTDCRGIPSDIVKSDIPDKKNKTGNE